MDEHDDEPDFGEHEALGGIGRMGLSIYRAVIRDGGNNFEAFNVTAAFFAGVMKNTMPNTDASNED